MPDALLPFQKIQKQITAYIRDPDHNKPPKKVKKERLNVYRDLLFNNVLEFLTSAFPVCTKILSKEQMQNLVRGFFKDYRAHSPYFHDIPKAFVEYLTELEEAEGLPIFLTELAHYEWVELALDIYDAPSSEYKIKPKGNLLKQIPVISPYAWLLQYQFPVHEIGKDYQPTAVPEQATLLVIVRDKKNQIHFIQVSLLTAHLINLLLQNPDLTGQDALQQLAEASQTDDVEQFIKNGLADLKNLQQQSIILGTRGTL